MSKKTADTNGNREVYHWYKTEEWARIQDAEEESDSPEFDPEPTDPWGGW